MGHRRDTLRDATRDALPARIRRHPRLWGLLFGALLLGAYPAVLQPVRVWLAAHVAAPLLAAVETPEDRPHTVVAPAGATVVLAVPTGSEGVEGGEAAAWGAPAGFFFLLAALVLIARFPARPLWLYLLSAHVALGLVTLGTFVLGQRLGWTPFAEAVHTFSDPYIAVIVHLAIPLLLYLAGRGREAQAAVEGEAAERSRPRLPLPTGTVAERRRS